MERTYANYYMTLNQGRGSINQIPLMLEVFEIIYWTQKETQIRFWFELHKGIWIYLGEKSMIDDY